MEGIHAALAMRAATRALDDAVRAGTQVPFFGRSEGLAEVAEHLTSALDRLDAMAVLVPTDAVDAARLVRDARAGVLEATGAAHARSGARQLDTTLAAPRARMADAFEALGRPGDDVADGALQRLASTSPPTAPPARLAALADRAERDITAGDLQDLAAIAKLPDGWRPAGIERAMADEFASGARRLAHGEALPNDWTGWAPLRTASADRSFATRDASAERFRTIAATSYDDMTDSQWRDVLLLADLPESRLPTQLHGADARDALRTLATAMRDGARPAADSPVWTTVDTLRAGALHADEPSASARLIELISLPDGTLTAQQTHELNGIVRLDAGHRPSVLGGTSADELLRDPAALRRTVQGHRWPTIEAATSEAIATLAPGYDQLDAVAYTKLADLADLSPGHRPEALSLGDGASMAETFRAAAANTPIPEDWAGWTQLNAVRMRAATPTREAAAARLAELTSKDTDALTRQDLHDLDGLLSLPDDLRPAHLARGEVKDVTRAAERLGAKQQVQAHWLGWDILGRVRAEQAWPTAAEARSGAGELLAGDAPISRATWRALADMSTLPADRRPALPPTEDLLKLAAPDATPPDGKWTGWAPIDRARADMKFTSRADAETWLRELAARPNDDVTAQDFHDLDGLLQLDEAIRPKMLERGPVTDLALAAEHRRSGTPLNELWTGWDILARVRADQRWPTIQSARAELETLLGAGRDGLDTTAWRTLAEMATLPAERRPPLPKVEDLLKAATTGTAPAMDWVDWSLLNQSRAAARFPTRAAAQEWVLGLAKRPTDELTAQDLHDLDGLLQLDDAIRPPSLVRGTVKDLYQAAEHRAKGTEINPLWQGWDILARVRADAAWPTLAEARSAAGAALATGYDEMTPAAWRTLSDMATLEAGRRPELPDLETLVKLANGGERPKPDWAGWRQLNKVRGETAWPTREAATKRIIEFADTPRESLTSRDLHDLDAALQLPDELKPDSLRGLDVTDMATAAEYRHLGKETNDGWMGWRVAKLGALERLVPLDPAERTAFVARELPKALRGEAFDPNLGIALRLRPELMPTDLQTVEQLRLAHVLLAGVDRSGLVNDQAARPALDAARAALESYTPADASLQALVEDTRELVETNLGRIDGKIASGTYLHYADLADVGRIRSNVELLARAEHGATATAPIPAAPAVAVDGAAPPVATGPEGTLTW